MNWHVYKTNDPNSWPKIDCPMVVCFYNNNKEMDLWVCTWNPQYNNFVRKDRSSFYTEECYYSYIGYVPRGYKTHYPTKCLCAESCVDGFDDNGYCMSDRTFACGHKLDVAEYSIEEKRIWKEFE